MPSLSRAGTARATAAAAGDLCGGAPAYGTVGWGVTRGVLVVRGRDGAGRGGGGGEGCSSAGAGGSARGDGGARGDCGARGNGGARGGADCDVGGGGDFPACRPAVDAHGGADGGGAGPPLLYPVWPLLLRPAAAMRGGRAGGGASGRVSQAGRGRVPTGGATTPPGGRPH